MIVLIFLSATGNISPSSFYSQYENRQGYFYNGRAQNSRVASAIDVPHHVLIVYSNLYCSGSLIYSKIVLSAASCFRKRKRHRCIVKVGSDRIVDPGQVVPVVEILQHEYFSHNNRMDNDIAILVLQNNVNFGPEVKKAILVEPDVDLRVGATIEVLGWGSNMQPQYTNKLLRSEMTLLDKTSCYNYHGNISPSNFCAKYQKESNLNDNGGSAIYKNYIVGVLSFGATNTQEPYIAVFTNISYFHKWIMINTRRLLKKYCVQDIYDTSIPSSEKIDNID